MVVKLIAKKLMPVFMGVFIFATVFAPLVNTAHAAPVDNDSAIAAADVVPAYDLSYSMMQTETLDIDLDTTQLFNGAQIMLDALSSPYLLIAGFGLGVAILGAIMKAVTHLRI
jgi:hypothetical protein